MRCGPTALGMTATLRMLTTLGMPTEKGKARNLLALRSLMCFLRPIMIVLMCHLSPPLLIIERLVYKHSGQHFVSGHSPKHGHSEVQHRRYERFMSDMRTSVNTTHFQLLLSIIFPFGIPVAILPLRDSFNSNNGPCKIENSPEASA